MMDIKLKLNGTIVGFLACFGLTVWSYDATYTAVESVTISDSGSYLVTGTGAGAVTVAENVVGVSVTYSNVTSTANALKLSAGSSATLVLLGESSIESATSLGIQLPETAALTVEGPGVLRIHSFGNSPCIGVGGLGARMGTLTVNGGRVEAICGAANEQGLSAAIGGAYNFGDQAGHGGTVVVNGGELIATAFSGMPAIGGGGCYYSNGKGTGGDGGTLTVTGGKVVARSYSTKGNFCDGQRSAAVGGGVSRNAGGKNGRAARITVTGGELEGWVDHAGATCFGNGTGAGTAQANGDDAGLTVTGGTVRWNCLRGTESDFSFRFENCAVGCSVGSESGAQGLWMPVATDVASFFGDGAVFERAPGDTVAIQAGGFALADLAQGDVVLSETGPFTLVGASAITANKIVVPAGTTVEAAVYGVRSTGGWEVPAGTQVTFWVYGSNTVDFNGVCCKLPATGVLKLKGSGSWAFTSSNSSLASAIGMAAGAGDWGTLEVDGPAVTATGSDRAAGVGGSYGYQSQGAGGGVVIVRSGTLTAYGYGGSAGIGGGSPYNAVCGSGPQVTVYTNGTLYAYNMAGNRGGPNKFDGCGVAIGAGRPLMDSALSCAASNAGTIVVDGGTVYASAGKSGVSCFGCPMNNSNTAFTQNPNATGSLTVKNGGKVFFNYATFPMEMKVRIDDGTLGTMANSPERDWVSFGLNQATVTNRLTLAGPVVPYLSTLPNFQNHPELVCEVPVVFLTAMAAGEWIVPVGPGTLEVESGFYFNEKFVESVRWVRSEVDDGWIRLKTVNSTYTISTNGVYRFTGQGATDATAIKVNPGVVCTGLFYNVSLTVKSGGVAPVELGAGSRMVMQLQGANSLKRSETPMLAVVRVPETASLVIEDAGPVGEVGSMTIDQRGILYDHQVGIGEAGAGLKSGSVTVDSGILTIMMEHGDNRHGGAAIGTAGRETTMGSYTQNGGTVSLDGPGLGPAIGGGTDNVTCGSGGEVVVNGGTLTAKGYGGASAIGLAPTYGSGVVGRPGSYRQTGGTVYAYAYAQGSYSSGGQCGAAIGGSGTRGGTTASTMGRIEISGGALLAYSEKGYSFGCGKPQDGEVPALAESDALIITGGSVWAQQGSQGTAVNAQDDPLMMVGVAISTLSGTTTTVDLGGAGSYVFPNVNLGDNMAYAWLPSCVATIAGRDYVQGVDRRVVHNFPGTRLTYVRGQVLLTTGNTLVKGKGAVAFQDNCDVVVSNFLYQATSAGGFGGAFAHSDNVAVSMTLQGTNTLQTLGDTSVINLRASSSLSISGGADDWLKIDETSTTVDNTVGIGVGGNGTVAMGTLILNSGNVEITLSKGNSGFGGAAVGVAAGNRTAGTVIVNGGSLLADGSSLAAGIGGGYNNGGPAGHGGRVEVNGGTVVAKGYGGAAGIGGGTGYNGTAGNGGTFLQRGGNVSAFAYKSCYFQTGDVGAAIGGGSRRDSTGKTGAAGTIIVSNGTLNVVADLGGAIGYGNPKDGIKGYDGAEATFTIAGGSIKMASSNVVPSNGVEAVACAVVPCKYAGRAPYEITVTSSRGGEWSYPYAGEGHPGDDNLYFYLPEGNYFMNSKTFFFKNGEVVFPGLIFIIR